MVKNRLEKDVKDSEIVCLCSDGHQNFTQRLMKKNDTEKLNKEEEEEDRKSRSFVICVGNHFALSPKDRSDGTCEVIC